MSDLMPVPRSRRRIASPLPLTPGDADILRAAVLQIIRGSEPAGQKSPPTEKEKFSH
jgi:hypothetical protein